MHSRASLQLFRPGRGEVPSRHQRHPQRLAQEQVHSPARRAQQRGGVAVDQVYITVRTPRLVQGEGERRGEALEDGDKFGVLGEGGLVQQNGS